MSLALKSFCFPSLLYTYLSIQFCRTPKRDEPIAASESILTATGDPLENIADKAKVNGVNLDANANAISSNQTIESQINTSAPNSSELADTNTTISKIALATSPDQVTSTDTIGLSASESAIEQAIEDSSAASAVPTIVDAPESDLRDTISSFAQVEPTPPISQEQSEVMSGTPSIFGAPDAPDAPVQDSVTEQPDLKIEAGSPAATPDQHDAFENLNIDNSTSNPTPTDSTAADLPLAQEETKPPLKDLDQGAMQIDREPSQPKEELKEEPASGMEDTNMADAPAVKVGREREDDDMEEPSAKRAKTDESFSNNHLDGSSASYANGNDAPPQQQPQQQVQQQETTITEHQKQEILKNLKNLGSRGGGKSFKAPVAELWPALAVQYSTLVTNPIDLRTMQEKLIDGVYHTLEDVKADARLLHDNAIAFNGPIHAVTKFAEETRKSIESKVNHLAAPPSGVKKDKKKRPANNASAAARAPANSSRAQSHNSPSNSVYNHTEDASTSYAVAPGGVPQARRGSVMNRPKREIVPPKNKDLPYSVRPKNKKVATELRFCEEILAEVNKPKYQSFVSAFTKPVDPVALGIPSYFQIIKRPMDLSTIARKLKEGSYASAGDFDKDMRLMLANCFKFNPSVNIVHQWGRELETLYDEEWAKKDRYMAQHAPTAASPPSAHDSDDEDEDEGEEAVDSAEGDMIEATRARLVEEQAKLITMMGNKSNAGMIAMQQSMVEIVQNSLVDAEANAKKKQQQSKKSKASRPVKKAAPIKKHSGPVKKEKKGSRYMGTLEKETISNGLGALPDNLTSQVLEWIQNDQGSLAVSCLYLVLITFAD